MTKQRSLFWNLYKNILRGLLLRVVFSFLTKVLSTPVTYMRTRAGVRVFKKSIAATSIVISFMTLLAAGLLNAGIASADNTNTINFQARLQSNAGAIVPDGYYNVEFKLYSASSGGSAEWTEDYTYNSGPSSADERVMVVDGYLSVSLGTITSFPGTINWNQAQYLTMNIGGTGGSGSFPSMGDGEMSPRLHLTAVPYAFSASQLASSTGSYNSTLGFATQTASNTLLLPNESGTLCSTGSVCSGYAPSSGSTNYIQNGTSLQSGVDFNISGTGTLGTSLTTPLVQSTSGSDLTIQSGTGYDIKLNPNGGSNTGVKVKPTTDSNAVFQIQNSSGQNILNVDSTSSTTSLTAGTDTSTIGTELNTVTNFTNVAWSSTGWTTTSSNATHLNGNTAVLSTSQFTLTNGNSYEVGYQLSGSTPAGSTLTVSIGSVAIAIYTFTGDPSQDSFIDSHLAVYTGGTPSLSFTPSSNFTGTISNVSVKQLTLNTHPAFAIKNVTGTTNLEARASSDTSNTFIGLNSGESNSIGTANTSLGSNSLVANSTGSNNVSVGTTALNTNTTGSSNTSIGSSALQSNTTGSSNTAVGANALLSNTNGTQNTALGAGTDVTSGNLTNITAIGYGASVSSSNTISLGNTSVTCVIIGGSSCSAHSGAELGVNGTGVASGGFSTGTPDVAEYIDTTAGIVAADVVVADKNNAEQVTTTSTPYDSSAVGVITNGTSGFQMLNSHYGQSFNSLNGVTDKNALPMAITGRVPVKVSGEGGAIQPGDYITTSSTAGYGMKASKAGAVVGKALGYFNGTTIGDKGTVLMLIDLSYYAGPTPSTDLQNAVSASYQSLNVNGTAIFSNINTSGTATINNLSVQTATVSGNLNVGGIATINTLNVTGSAVFNGDIVVGGHIITNGIQPTISVQPNAGQPIKNDLLSKPSVATISGNDTAGTITITTSDSPTAGDIANVTFNKAYTSSPHIIISGQDGKSVGSLMYPSNKSDTGFELHIDNAPLANTTYTFDYFITQ